MTDDELLASIARKIIADADYLDLVGPGDRKWRTGRPGGIPYVVIDSTIDGWTQEQIDLIDSILEDAYGKETTA